MSQSSINSHVGWTRLRRLSQAYHISDPVRFCPDRRVYCHNAGAWFVCWANSGIGRLIMLVGCHAEIVTTCKTYNSSISIVL